MVQGYECKSDNFQWSLIRATNLKPNSDYYRQQHPNPNRRSNDRYDLNGTPRKYPNSPELQRRYP